MFGLKCKWYVYVTRVDNDRIFRINTKLFEHDCPDVKQNMMTTSTWIVKDFFSNFRNNSKIYMNTVKNNAHSNYGLVHTNNKIYRTYQTILRRFIGFMKSNMLYYGIMQRR